MSNITIKDWFFLAFIVILSIFAVNIYYKYSALEEKIILSQLQDSKKRIEERKKTDSIMTISELNIIKKIDITQSELKKQDSIYERKNKKRYDDFVRNNVVSPVLPDFDSAK